MALPSVNYSSDSPSSRVVNALNRINEYANKSHIRQFNKVKAQYAPELTKADIASKNAYAALVGLQPLGKILGNELAYANTSDAVKAEINQRFLNAGGIGALPFPGVKPINSLNNMPQIQQNSGIGQPSTNSFSGRIKNAFHALLGQTAQDNQNMINMPSRGYNNDSNPNVSAQGPGPIDNGNQFVNSQGYKTPPSALKPPKGGVTLEGEQWYNDKGEPVYADEQEETQQPNENHKKTFYETAAEQKGIVKEGEELGKHRAQVINDIGEQQMQLSTTGSNLDRIIEDINDPKFIELRKDFPFYQDMQLNALSKIGSPEQQEMIGNFIADVKSFAGATVNSFKGQSMKREFDYAEQLKPNENDTVNTARGKLTAIKTLKDIAEKKNDIILNLLENKHMNVGDAVKLANKSVDDKSIAKEVKKLTSPMITLKDPKNPSITIRLPLWEARQRGVKNV